MENIFFRNDASRYQVSRLKEEAEKLGVNILVKQNRDFVNFVDEGEIRTGYAAYDFCIYLDKDRYVSRIMERAGIRLFNRGQAVELCDDKMLTHIFLADSGIPMPKTIPSALCYDPNAVFPEEFYDKVISELGLPMVVKPAFGSFGVGVTVVKTREELKSVTEKLKLAPHLYQRFVASSFGRDMRVTVIGGKVVCAMARHSQGDFRSNIELGGTGTGVEPPKEVVDMCEKAARLLDLDYCGIDILYGENGYYLDEVNSNAYFGGTERATGVNVAEIYAKHIYNTIYN